MIVLASAHSHSFSLKPSVNPTMGVSSENILISNVPKHLQCSVKTKYPFDLPPPTCTKNLNVYNYYNYTSKIHFVDYIKLAFPLRV